MSWSRALGVVVALVVGASPACLLQLGTDVSCGDGHVDARAGEQCDPGDLSSYVDGCRATSRPDGIAACDPDTCQLINTRAQCGDCGDGFIDEELGEQCDGDALNGEKCPTGDDAMQCTSECQFDYSRCPLCGNGDIDGDEECDMGIEGASNKLGSGPRSCAGETDFEALRHPASNLPYTSGTITSCVAATCKWDRVNCGFCGNGTLDKGFSIEGTAIPDEWCDGGEFDLSKIAELQDGCDGDFERANVGCEDNCRGFVDRSEFGPLCCLTHGAPCAPESAPTRCCAEYEGTVDDDICYTSIEAQGEVTKLCI